MSISAAPAQLPPSDEEHIAQLLSLVPVPALKPGSTIGIVSPSGCISNPSSFQVQLDAQMQALGFKTKYSASWANCYGYLAGTDQQRASSLMAMFTDPSVSMVLASRGGWGCARILPLLDYDLIAKNPKPFMYD
ncbi:MAG: LD-carboxypeptidase [archaeon]|nr:LD-carboxypeptidase [archaeon]